MARSLRCADPSRRHGADRAPVWHRCISCGQCQVLGTMQGTLHHLLRGRRTQANASPGCVRMLREAAHAPMARARVRRFSVREGWRDPQRSRKRLISFCVPIGPHQCRALGTLSCTCHRPLQQEVRATACTRCAARPSRASRCNAPGTARRPQGTVQSACLSLSLQPAVRSRPPAPVTLTLGQRGVSGGQDSGPGAGRGQACGTPHSQCLVLAAYCWVPAAVSLSIQIETSDS